VTPTCYWCHTRCKNRPNFFYISLYGINVQTIILLQRKKPLIFAAIPFWHTFFEVAIATQQNNYTLILSLNLRNCMLDYSFLLVPCNLCFATYLCTMLSNNNFWKDKTSLVSNLHIVLWRVLLHLCFQSMFCSFFFWALW
jgi:hypothetical protein